MEFEHEDYLGIPYEPTIEEREALASALWWEIRKKLELDYIPRFNGKAHYKSPIPQGEDLLRYARFEHRGAFGGYSWFLASIHLPCPAPVPDGTRDKDPYNETFELRIPKGQWQEWQSYGDDAHLQPFDTVRSRNNADKRIATIALAIAALIVGGIISESQSGMMTAAQKKVQAWWSATKDMTNNKSSDALPPTNARRK